MIVSGHNNSFWGTNVPGHNHIWVKKVCGHKRVWAQTCPGANASGHKRVWAQTGVGTVMWAQSCMGTNMVELYFQLYLGSRLFLTATGAMGLLVIFNSYVLDIDQ